MIARISGKIIEKGTNNLIIDVGGICYEILVPAIVMQRLDQKDTNSQMVNLITYHYHQVESSRSTPVLIGFLNEVEKEFFEVFITVSGIGPRAALKALIQPISSIAKAIDEADINFLKSLPGIGQQKARDIIAKLQNKVGKFGLIQDNKLRERETKSKDIEEEALFVLVNLEYKKHEAVKMIKEALQNCPELQTTEELLNQVYKQKKAL